MMYDLVAVSNHMGAMGFGHYTAFARDLPFGEDEWRAGKLPGHWYLFDDARVTPVDPGRVCSRAAYVLVYRRRRRPSDLKGAASRDAQDIAKAREAAVPDAIGLD